MTLHAGSRLGPYEILSPIGAGGMGEVFRARDTRLSRDVAVKILSSRLAPTPEARQRFEREARTVSQLSHPNVCALYDVGREGETEYLVMELIEGETLTMRLARGAMPVEQALRFGAEIASALQAAHRKGIVHRDLKPGNVMLTKTGVKLLDFGLARAFELPVVSGELTRAKTVTVADELTAEGVIVGTVPYMAPEQLRGEEADARTDVFALGTVLYEMFTGRRAFSGASQATLIAAILTSEPPPIADRQPLSPPGLESLVRTCIAKDPADRWQSAHDVELQLRAFAVSGAISRTDVAVPRKPPRAAAWLRLAAAIAAALALAVVAWMRPGASRAPAPTVRFAVPPPEGGGFGYDVEGTFLAVSPDGTELAYTASGAKGPLRLWVRPIGAFEARAIAGTEGAYSVMWSPDGKSIAFFTIDKLKRVALAGGAPLPICDVPPGGGRKSGTWGKDGIVFTSIQGGELFHVPASGGQADSVATIDPARKEFRFAWPWFLPDGERFLYILRSREGWGDLMLWEAGKAPRKLARLSSAFQYVEPGYLVYSREGALVAQRFDAKSARILGEPIAVADQVRYFYSTAAAGFAARAGTIAYQSQSNSSRLAWIDRSGAEVGTVGPPGAYLSLFFSRDGRRLFFDRTRPGLETYHVWSYDLERGVETAITNGIDTEIMPLLLPDGKTLFFSAVRGTPPMLVRLDLATGREELVTAQRRSFQMAQDLSPDGRTLVFTERGDTGNFDIWTLDLSGAGKLSPLFQTAYEKMHVRFSPDGRYLGFISTESGRPEAYVMPYPGPGERVRVSQDGARALRWSRSGDLYYLSGDGHMISVPVATTPVLRIGSPTALFKVPGRPWVDFAIAPDGRRFLAIVPEIIGDEGPLNVILNWTPGGAN